MSWLTWLTSLFTRSAPPPPRAAGGDFIDASRRQREPSARELLTEPSTPPGPAPPSTPPSAPATSRTSTSAPSPARPPRCATRPLSHKSVPSTPWFAQKVLGTDLAEVTDHPLLALLAQFNPHMNAFDLWESTGLSLEVFGVAYWLLDFGPLGVPAALWPLPAQFVQPQRVPYSPSLVDH